MAGGGGNGVQRITGRLPGVSEAEDRNRRQIGCLPDRNKFWFSPVSRSRLVGRDPVSTSMNAVASLARLIELDEHILFFWRVEKLQFLLPGRFVIARELSILPKTAGGATAQPQCLRG